MSYYGSYCPKTCSIECRKKLNSRHTAEALMKKYGNPVGANSKSGKEKAKKTKLEKYGSETYNNRELAAKTCLERFGSRSYPSSKDGRKKLSEIERRFHQDNSSETARQVYAKRGLILDKEADRESIIEKYEILVNDEKFNEFLIGLAKKLGRKPFYEDIVKVLGCQTSTLARKRSRNKTINDLINVNKDSYLETLVNDQLIANNMKEDRFKNSIGKGTYWRRSRRIIPPLELDFYIPAMRIAFEVQDFATHSKNSDKDPTEGIWSNRLHYKNGPTYHTMKRNRCNDIGIVVHELWEDEIRSDILSRKIKDILEENW